MILRRGRSICHRLVSNYLNFCPQHCLFRLESKCYHQIESFYNLILILIFKITLLSLSIIVFAMREFCLIAFRDFNVSSVIFSWSCRRCSKTFSISTSFSVSVVTSWLLFLVLPRSC
jgi:hypothetical protein